MHGLCHWQSGCGPRIYINKIRQIIWIIQCIGCKIILANSYIVQRQNGNKWDTVKIVGAVTSYMVKGSPTFIGGNFRVVNNCNAGSQVGVSNTAKAPAKYFVASNGSAANPGTIALAWSWAHVCSGANNTIKPGDSIFVRGGTYKGNFEMEQLNGNDSMPVVIKNYNGERVIMDGYIVGNAIRAPALTIGLFSSFVQIIGLEFTSSFPTRVSATDGDIYSAGGIQIAGNHIKVINCNIHELPGSGSYAGVSAIKEAKNVELYGCLIYNNGYMQPSKIGIGTGIFFQNENAATPKIIKNNFVFRNYGIGMNVTGSDINVESINGINIDSNIVFNTGALLMDTAVRGFNTIIGGYSSTNKMKNINVRGNVFYRDTTDGLINGVVTKAHNRRYNVAFGIKDSQVYYDSSLLFTNNKLVGGFWNLLVRNSVAKYNFTSNTLYNPNNLSYLIYVNSGATPTFPGTQSLWDNNHYYSALPNSLGANNVGMLLSQWTTKFHIDSNSVKGDIAAVPPNSYTLVKNRYDANCYYLTVLNYSNNASFSLDINNSALKGKKLLVTDVQNNMGKPVLDTMYNGGAIVLPMTLTAVDKPTPTIAKQPRHTNPALGTFILRFFDDPIICPGGSTSFTSNMAGTTYRWQLSTDSGKTFSSISDSAGRYTGTNSATLQLTSLPSYYYGNKYRCLVNNVDYSTVNTLRFAVKWTGALSHAWENPLNWSCGILPDAYSDVVFANGDSVVLSSVGKCRTLTAQSGSVIQVSSASANLTISKSPLVILPGAVFKASANATVTIKK